MKTISIRFRCGHFESHTPKEIKKQEISISAPFKINGKLKAESAQYCLDCSSKGYFCRISDGQ